MATRPGMDKDTKIGGNASQFPLTRWSAIEAARSDNPKERTRALEVLVRAYWKPVYKTIRVKWRKGNEDAKDLTQAFFMTALEKDYFKNFDPTKARFRTYLRTCLHGFIANSERAAGRIKRGGDRQILSLDFEGAETELAFSQAAENQTAEDFFYHEWVRQLFVLSVEELRDTLASQDRTICFLIFERYDLQNETDEPTYETLAAEFKLHVTQVTNNLARARREFRRILLQKLREITMTETEFQNEASSLLGLHFETARPAQKSELE
ncbi:MAG: sigma-70 family RNA polymerase sigma factor [bacterium]